MASGLWGVKGSAVVFLERSQRCSRGQEVGLDVVRQAFWACADLVELLPFWFWHGVAPPTARSRRANYVNKYIFKFLL